MSRHWIQKATRKNKGSLKRWAKKHRLTKSNGNISLTRASKYAKRHHNTRREREINLARNLRKMKRR